MINTFYFISIKCLELLIKQIIGVQDKMRFDTIFFYFMFFSKNILQIFIKLVYALYYYELIRITSRKILVSWPDHEIQEINSKSFKEYSKSYFYLNNEQISVNSKSE